MLWVAFIKGAIIGLLIYQFFLLNNEIRSFKRNNKKKKKIKMNLQLLQIWQQVIVRFLKVESH